MRRKPRPGGAQQFDLTIQSVGAHGDGGVKSRSNAIGVKKHFKFLCHKPCQANW